MKNSIFREILNEECIEVNKSVSETIRCLCELSGSNRFFEDEKVRVFFFCNQNGKIFVRRGVHARRYRILHRKLYHVDGEIISKDGKTYVKLTSVYNRIFVWLTILSVLFMIALIPIVIFLMVTVSSGFLAPVIAAVVAASAVAVNVYSLCDVLNRGNTLIRLMEDELKRHLSNLEQWDK